MKEDLYINREEVTVWLIDKEKIDKNKYEWITHRNIEEVDKKEIKIKFAGKLTDGESGEKKTENIFKKKAGNDFVPDIERKGDTITVKNMCLLPYLTLEEFKYIIATILKIDSLSIFNIFPEDDEEAEFINDIDKEYIKKCKLSYNNDKLTDYISLSSCTTIGYHKIYACVAYDGKEIIGNYDFKFYPRYTKLINYINNITKDLKNDFTREEIINNSDVQNYEVLLINATDKYEPIENINIIKLFTILHTSINLKKIVINDSSLTEYNLEDRETQYAKTLSEINDGFKNTFSRFNCCSIYVINDITPGILLSRIEIYKDGFIKCCFIINDPGLSEITIKEQIREYFKKELIDGEVQTTGKFWKLLDKLNLSECIYNYYYDNINMIPIYHNVSYVLALDGVKAKNFKGAIKLVDQDIPTVVYSTNTSAFLSVYSNINYGLFYNYIYSKKLHTLVTEATVKADVLTHLHVQKQDEDTCICAVSKCYNIDDYIMNILLILPLFDKDFKSTESDENLENLPLEQRVKKIRKKYQKIPTKKALKKLNETDPVLFDNRYITETESRPYSALAQKKEQRVVSITKNEYEDIIQVDPEYASNIRNQTQGNQRLYLFCPYEKFPYLNYHHYHNQLCIPKCTTNITKRSQYLFCNNQLDAKDVSNKAINDASKMVVYYSPLLAPGRRCHVPEELAYVCENYIMYKVEPTENIYDYCLNNYNCLPFIITRDNINKCYVMNSEIDNENEYMLILQSELDSMYYIIYTEITHEPYLINEHEEFKEFINSIQLNKSSNFVYFNFINDVFKLGLSEEYKTLSFTKLIKYVVDKFGIKFVSDVSKNNFIGVFKDNILLFTEKVEVNINNFKNMFVPINNVINSCEFPGLELFNDEYITKYYKDYTTGKIHVIEYEGIDIIIDPIDENELSIFNPNIVLFDYEAYLNIYKFATSKRTKEKKFKDYKFNNELEQFVSLLIYIYYNTFSFKVFDVENFINTIKSTNLITDKESLVKYINKDSEIVSWKESKINENDLRNVLNNINPNNFNKIIDLMFNELNTSMNIYNIKDNEKLHTKIITNNTV